MNKYQEALDEIKGLEIYDDDSDGNTCYKSYSKIEDLYSFDLLQELVDKATPKKPVLGRDFKNEFTTIYDEDGFIYGVICVCPNCGEYSICNWEYGIKFKHCSNCGQALDWSNEC